MSMMDWPSAERVEVQGLRKALSATDDSGYWGMLRVPLQMRRTVEIARGLARISKRQQPDLLTRPALPTRSGTGLR